MFWKTCFAATFAAVLAHSVAAQTAVTRLTITPRSTLVLTGTSNVSGWRCAGGSLAGTMIIAAPIERINDVIDRVENGDIAVWMSDRARARFPQPRFDVEIPIKTLRCSGGKPMERDLQSALKADAFPAIRFHFRELRGAVSHDIDSNTYQARIEGEVSIAGATRPLELSATARRLSRDRFRLQADMPLRMTDFGIAPPRALFGLVRAADALTVSFDLTVEAE